jgi:iron-sulfur cluster insertion protein
MEGQISLTERAAEKILEIRATENIAPEKILRVAVRGGGCAGFSYDLFFDDPNPDIDQRFTIKGVELAVDSMSLMYLVGTELEYEDGLKGSGFKFNNPNVKSTCGCGSSFSA